MPRQACATPEAKRDHRLKLWLGGVCIAVEFGFFLALLGFGISAEFSRWASRLAGGNAWAEVALYLLAFGALNELVSYPAAHARGYWLERKFGLSRQSCGGWLADHAKIVGRDGIFPDKSSAFARFG